MVVSGPTELSVGSGRGLVDGGTVCAMMYSICRLVLPSVGSRPDLADSSVFVVIACVYVAIKCHFVILFLSLLCVTVFLSSGRGRWVCYEYAGRFFLVSFCKGETVPIFPHSNTQSTKIIRETEGTVDISRSTVASVGE